MLSGPNLTPYLYLMFDGLFFVTLGGWVIFSFILTYHWLHYSPRRQSTGSALLTYFATSGVLWLGFAIFWMQLSA